jgi:hypothetical protein
MNVKIGAEAALFPEKEYIKGIFVAVCQNFLFALISPVSRKRGTMREFRVNPRDGDMGTGLGRGVGGGCWGR